MRRAPTTFLLVCAALRTRWKMLIEDIKEQLSHELAVRFAKKCFTPLEITHFKDIFRSLADVQDGMHYWKEETLCRFLVLPDALDPGPLVYQMATSVKPA